jgi:hypothetical protein
MPTMKVPPYGSLKAILSRIGNHLAHYYGSMENVHSLSPGSFALTNIPLFLQLVLGRVSSGSSLPTHLLFLPG